MDAVSDPKYPRVVFMKSAQTGGTEIANNAVGFFVHQDPAPILIVQPTLDMAKAWSKDRFAPMLRDTPALKGSVQERRAKNSDNTILHKTFPGGHITMAGANSPASLASRPIRITIFDEVDRFPPSAGPEGDPVSLGRKRSTTFWNRVSLEISTPTVKDASRIEQSYGESTMDRYYVPCPHCEESQILEWKHCKWPKDQPSEAYYGCPHCGGVINDTDLASMLKSGEWRSEYPDRLVRGFHINELYSPWVSFAEMATAFVDAKRFPDTLKTWVNTALGETWEEEGETADEHALYMRREHYAAEVPDGVQYLTAYADVQDDRIEYEVCGWGAEEESWSISYVRLYGDLSKQQIWDVLANRLRQRFSKSNGDMLDIRLVGIDSGGHYTDEVYKFARKNGIRWIIPTKGSSQRNQPIASFPRKPNQKNKVYLTLIGTDTAKELIYCRYLVSDPGPGYCHYPVSEDYDEVYFQQATAEKKVKRYTHGVAYYVWDAGKRRNEALDCRVGNLAMIRILQSRFGVKLLDKTVSKIPQSIPARPPPRQRQSSRFGRRSI